MHPPKICLCLTCSTLAEDLAVLNTYRRWIDMVELRADYLADDERLYIRRFPAMAGLPVILTIRRIADGGVYKGGEAARTALMARGLAFASQDTRKNFAYIDLEEDLDVPSIQDAALAFGTRIIRSLHNMKETVADIPAKMAQIRKTGYEIPKIACMPQRLTELSALFKEAATLNFEHIVCTMGALSVPSRILAERTGSFLTYCSPPGVHVDEALTKLGHVDPVQLNTMYNFRAIDENTALFGITGYPLAHTLSPELHNTGYRKHGMNAVYIPIKSESVEDALEFAETLGMKGLSVTVPHKETVLSKLEHLSEEAAEIKACNTVVRTQTGWTGYNTDIYGITQALLEFLNVKNLRGKKVAIIGAGGAAKAVAHAVYKLKGKACIFNRTLSSARNLAQKYRFKYSVLGVEGQKLLEKYSWLIIQTTSVGMGTNKKDEGADPIDFYGFCGTEQVYDIIYSPEKTPLLYRAEKAGCRICNGYSMLKHQAYKQFELFTGEQYEC
ncbi:shikimate dehydrogenase [Treponema sp. OMZ 840]|uniref:shikimate dehydrogenase n=1 Tax=Treponema sp. OMZ 840 TaxID=244313 RepID=UPI003D900DD1